MASFITISLYGIIIYFLCLILIVSRHPSIFFRRFGRNHRLAGLVYLCILLQGVWDQVLIDILGEPALLSPIYFDLLLGFTGIVLSLSAAYDFRFAHDASKVQNIASGALDESATITVAEMIEHSFYQIVNVVQALFLHVVWRYDDLFSRLIALALVTSPWLFRSLFPINHFSDNYTKAGTDPASIIGILYRLKKYQYLLYKHCLLHGLNITVAFTGLNIASTTWFRLYWLSLNTAYVMEFFMQTLVKRRLLDQSIMLALNQFLMLVSTSTAWPVLSQLLMAPCVVSLVMNLTRRGRDFSNVSVVCAITFLIKTYHIEIL
jgi:hypothetical protein